jgi:hypothetical protein
MRLEMQVRCSDVDVIRGIAAKEKCSEQVRNESEPSYDHHQARFDVRRVDKVHHGLLHQKEAYDYQKNGIEYCRKYLRAFQAECVHVPFIALLTW